LEKWDDGWTWRSETMYELEEVWLMRMNDELMEMWDNGWTQGRLRHTLDEGWESNFLGANLDWFEANWILEVGLYLGPNQIDVPSKTSAMEV
jgi:hypothetical protein